MSLTCPTCGMPISIGCLCSEPPQFGAVCCFCGFILPWYKRKDRFAEITQQELDQAREDNQ